MKLYNVCANRRIIDHDYNYDYRCDTHLMTDMMKCPKFIRTTLIYYALVSS